MKAERQRVIIAFADITDFGPWARRSEPDEFTSLMSKVYDEFFRFQLSNGCLMKLLADGFVAFQPLHIRNDRKAITRFLKEVNECGVRTNRIISSHVLPRPRSLRTRVVIGPAWRVTLHGGLTDYLGYQVNYCQRLLDVGRDEEDFIASESVFDALGRRSAGGVKFREVRIDGTILSGVDPEDLKKVYAFKVGKK